MGLFDFLFKSKPKVSVSFQETPHTKANYDPWDKKKGNSNTDYSNAVFLNSLSYKPSMIPKSPDDCPRYFSYNLGIHDPIAKYKEFIKMGYFRDAEAAEILNTYKVPELKEILEKNGLSASSRKKSDLIDRILECVTPSSMNLPNMYCVSDQGLAYLEEHQDLVQLHRNPYGITYDEYITTKKAIGATSSRYNDVIWAVFNRREMFSGGSHGAKRNNAYNRAKFLQSENKKQESLRYYIHAMYYDINDSIRIVPDCLKKDWDGHVSQLPPALLEAIFELQEFYSSSMVDECYKELHVAKVLITRKNFERLLKDIIAGNEIDLRNYIPKGLR